MSVIRSCILAFSIYSKIPMPQLPWKDSDMRYILCFFPCVGAVIGTVVWGWAWLCPVVGIGTLCKSLITAAIPLAVTGGFHMDGFLDTMDAFHSYQPRERKLEILKDSHVGAFAVIMLALYLLVNSACISEIKNARVMTVYCMGFVLSRILSGLGVVFFTPAKKDGMLVQFASAAHEKVVKAILFLELFFCAGGMLFISLSSGIFQLAAAFLFLWYYYRKTKKELGGITGDTAGYFVSMSECVFAVFAAVASHFL